jgi:hypothetical protein
VQISDVQQDAVVQHYKCLMFNDQYLVITDGSKQCQQPTGKFSLETDSSPDTHTVDSLEVNWNEILETRLVYP